MVTEYNNMGKVWDKDHPMSEEERQAILDQIEDDPTGDEGEPPLPNTGDPMLDRWIVDNESINKYGF